MEIIDVHTGEVKAAREDTILKSAAISPCVVIAAEEIYEDIKRAHFVRMLVDDEKYSLEGAVRKSKANESLKDLLEKA